MQENRKVDFGRAGPFGPNARLSRLKQDAKAAEDLALALRLDPRNSEALAAMARHKIQQGRTRQALDYAQRLLDAAAASGPEKLAQAHVERALLYKQLAQAASMEADLRKALSIESSLVAAALSLAGLMHSQKRHREALEILELRVPAPHDDPVAYADWMTVRSLIKSALKDAAGSQEDLRAAIAADPRRACSHSNSLIERSRMGLDYFGQCLAHFPRDSKLLADRGVARYFLGDKGGAASDLRQSLRLKPDSLEAALSLAALLQEQRALPQARAVLEAALAKAAPKTGDPLRQRALALRDSLGAR